MYSYQAVTHISQKYIFPNYSVDVTVSVEVGEYNLFVTVREKEKKEEHEPNIHPSMTI